MIAALDLAAWLREQVEGDLARWRKSEAAYLPNIEREGEVLWWQARENADRLEAELAILDEHRPGDGAVPGEVCCRTCGDFPQVPFPCRTVRLLGSGYRHRDGYDASWAP